MIYVCIDIFFLFLEGELSSPLGESSKRKRKNSSSSSSKDDNDKTPVKRKR